MGTLEAEFMQKRSIFKTRVSQDKICWGGTEITQGCLVSWRRVDAVTLSHFSVEQIFITIS